MIVGKYDLTTVEFFYYLSLVEFFDYQLI